MVWLRPQRVKIAMEDPRQEMVRRMWMSMKSER
jgi:hypothetical protein